MLNEKIELTLLDKAKGAKFYRLRDLELLYMGPSLDDVRLVDNGTLDTVLSIPELDLFEHYNPETVEAYRSEDGTLDLQEFWDDVAEDDFRESVLTLQSEYGLSWEYVPAQGKDAGFWRYLFSWGGPSEELRFYTDQLGNVYKTRFVYKDWFEHCSLPVEHNVINHIIDNFKDCGMFTIQNAGDY